MPIEDTLDQAKFEALPENQRAFYTAQSDGSFKLDVVPAKQAKGAADSTKKAADEAAQRLAAFEGIDPEVARTLLKEKQEREAAALAEKDKDGSIRAANAAAKAAKEAADKEAADKVSAAKKGFDARLIGLEVRALATASGVLADALDDVIAIAQAQGFASDDETGELIGPKGLTPAAWLKDYLGKKAYLVGKSEGGNTPPRNGKAPSAGLKKSTMTPKEKGEYVSKHGQQAFRDLPA